MRCEKEDIFKLGRLVTCSKCGWYNVWPKTKSIITELTFKEYKEWKKNKIRSETTMIT